MSHPEPRTLKLDMPDAAPEEGFAAAKRLAQLEAERDSGPVMLVSWKDELTGMSSPDVEACTCGVEGWEQYAISRGSELRVEVGGKYVFYFKIL